MKPGPWARISRAPVAQSALIIALPDYTAVAFAGFAVGPMLLLLANHFVPSLALLLGVIGAAAAVCWYGRPARCADRDAGRHAGWWTLAALAFVLVWAVVNCFYSNQDVYAIRDPSTYAIAGRWLFDHHSIKIDTMPQIFGFPASAPGVASGGFNNIEHTQIVYAQGNHLLPVMLGITGRFLGITAMLAANILFGAAGLFVFFGLVRKVVGSAPLALAATAALAFSIPYVYVSRDTYSEPLTMLFLMGGLSLLYRAGRSGSPRQYALAGFVGACSALVRVDSYAGLTGFAAAAAMVCLVATRAGRWQAARCALAVLVGGAIPTVMGWADVAWLSRQYYWSQHSNITALIKLLVSLVVLVPIIAAIGWTPRVHSALRSQRTRTVVTRTAVVLVGVVFVGLLSRPLWYHQDHTSYDPVLAALQKRSGVKVDGLSTYGELTLNWQSWYFGWATVVLGGAGYALLVHRMLARRDYALVGLLGTGMALSALYLWNPQIYPDQPWAMRRYIPVVIPLMLLAATAALRALTDGTAAGWVRRRLPSGPRVARALAGVLVAVMVAFPLVITAPVWTLRQEYPQLAQLDALCRVLPPDAAVIEVDPSAQTGYAQTLRSFCHVPTYAFVRERTGLDQDGFRKQVAQVYRVAKAHGYRLYALSGDPNIVPLAPGTSQQPFSTIWTFRWSTRINHVPGGPVRPTDAITVHLGLIDADGYAHPVIGGPLFATAQQQKKAGY